jgi:hypothetical protein
LKSCTLYIVFVFFVMMFVSALSIKPDQFRFRNGDPATPEQRAIAIFVFFLLVIGGRGEGSTHSLVRFGIIS